MTEAERDATRDVLAVVLSSGAKPPGKRKRIALGFARTIAEQLGDGAVDVLAIGPGAAALGAGLACSSVRSVFVAEHPGLDPWTAEAGQRALEALFTSSSGESDSEIPATAYRAIVAVTTSATRELFPRLAGRLDLPLASDVVGIEDAGVDSVRFARSVYCGNLIAETELTAPTILVTGRASSFPEVDLDAGPRDVRELSLPGELAHPGKRLIGRTREDATRPDLQEASVVVSAGRGTRGPDEGIPLCEQLADAFGGALGATRAVVDAGWLPNDLQVGQTGKIVAPDVYFAVGLSGAIQHLAGMRGAKTIVAINKDPEAPIFDIADIGLVGDLFDVLPELVEELGERSE